MAKFAPSLFDIGFAVGALDYDDHYLKADEQNRIVLSVTPQAETEATTEMIVDTGAPWCLLNPELYKAWGLELETEQEPKLAVWIRGRKWLGI